MIERAASVFGGSEVAAEPKADLKELHAKIGQQALEIDFLEGALSRLNVFSIFPTLDTDRGPLSRLRASG